MRFRSSTSPLVVRSLAAMLIAAAPDSSAASQVRPCVDLATQIADGLRNRGVTHFTLKIVRPDAVGDRRVVGSCQGSTRRIVYEPRGSGEVVEETPMPRKEVAPPLPVKDAVTPVPPKVTPSPAPVTVAAPPATPVSPTPAPAASVSAAPTLSVKPVDPSAAPRSLARGHLASVRKLAVDEGADDRDTLDEFVSHLKISPLPDLSGGSGRSADYLLLESTQLDAASAFTMITSNGKVIVAERSSWLVGLLPEQHAGMFDLCLLVRDFPAPGSNYSDWTAEFNGTRYVKKTRQYKSESCLDRVVVKIAR